MQQIRSFVNDPDDSAYKISESIRESSFLAELPVNDYGFSDLENWVADRLDPILEASTVVRRMIVRHHET